MLLKGKVFSAQDPGVKIIKTNGPLSNGLLKRLHPAVPPQWTPVIRELLLPERTFRLVRDVASFYARGYEKDGPAKVRYWREHHGVVFFPGSPVEVFVQFDLRYGRAVHAGHNLGTVGEMMLKSNDMSSRGRVFHVQSGQTHTFMSRVARHIHSRSG